MKYAEKQGGFYYIEVKPIAEYKTFRTLRNTSEKDGIERVGGQREDGSWDTVKWLVNKEMAHVENGKLVADDPAVKELFDRLGSKPKQIEGVRFRAKDRAAG